MGAGRSCIFTVLICIFCTSLSLPASPSNLRFHKAGVQDGLSQGSILSALQDKYGFIWIATQDGLNRFDGYGFLTFKHDPRDQESISGNFVQALYEDTEGTLWVGCKEGGLNRYDHRYRKFIRFPKNKKLIANNIKTITEDHDGHLWIGTYGDGLYLYENKQNGKQLQLEGPKAVNALKEDAQHRLWVASEEGLFYLDPERQHFQKVLDIPCNTLSIAREKSLWVGTYGHGLMHLNLENQANNFSQEHYQHNTHDSNSLVSNEIWSLHEDSHGVLWIGTDQGLSRFYVFENRYETIQQNVADVHSLSSNAISSIFEDRTGVLWFGTWSHGMNWFDRSSEQFTHYNQSSEPALSASAVSSIYEGREGKLWVGTYLAGLNKFHLGSNEPPVYYRHDPDDPTSISSDQVRSVIQDRTGQIWVGTYPGGLNMLNPETEKFTLFKHNAHEPNSLSDNRVLSLREDNFGFLWVGTKVGLNRLETNGTFTVFKVDQENPNTLSNDEIRCILEDGNGNIWVGTANGLNYYDRKTQNFISYFNDPEKENSLSHNGIRSLHKDENNTLWVGTRRGLNRFDTSNQSFRVYLEKDGLPNSFIYSILSDERGHLWLGTNRGLARFDPSSETFRSFGLEDGLQGNEFNTNAAFRGRSGKMFFGGQNGFNSFFPAKIKPDLTLPQVSFTELYFLNQEVPLSKTDETSPLHQAIEVIDEIVLKKDTSVFSVAFASLHFANPSKNRYAYKLEDFDKDWVYTNANLRRASYTNLDHGTYILKVKSSNKDDTWSAEPKTLKIIIPTPTYLSGLAIAFYILLGFLLLWFSWAMFAQRQIRRSLELMVQNRSRALEMRTGELESLEDIIKTINQETELSAVLRTVLEQGLRLFPQTDQAFFLLSTEDKKHYELAAKVPGDLPEKNILVDRHMVMDQYMGEAFDGSHIYLSHTPTAIPLSEANDPIALTTMSVSFLVADGIPSGVILFHNYGNPNAFDDFDRNKLQRFREHVRSAFARARTLEELHRKNEEILRVQQHVILQEKMASLGLVTAGVAHEIKNPVNYAHNSALNLEHQLNDFLKYLIDLSGETSESEIVQSLKHEMDPIYDTLGLIQDGTHRITQIVRDLRSMSREDKKQPVVTDLSVLISSTLNLVRPNYSDCVTFEIDSEKNLELECLPSQINQVLMNLIVNGCQAIKERQEQEGHNNSYKMSIRGYVELDTVAVEISDEGCGMSPDVLEKMYTPFFTTKTEGEGTGLGLAITYRIINQHQGRIEVTSEPGQGTSFKINFPKEQTERQDHEEVSP